MKRRTSRTTKMARGRTHVCATSVRAGDLILLAGRAVGYQPIEARVLSVECEPVMLSSGHGRITHTLMLVVEDCPVPVRGVGARVREPVTLTVRHERPGEEGLVSRKLSIVALRAWAVQCPATGHLTEAELDHLLTGVL